MDSTTAVGSAYHQGSGPTHAADAAAHSHGHVHAVCWGAIFAGAAGAASLSLVLLILGVGLGFSSVSPWASEGISAQAFGVSTIVWLAFTQLAASGMGGYLAGRLRVRWASLQSDEVYFRDTAHGFLAWSLATLVTAATLTTTVGAIISGGAQAGMAASGAAVSAAAAAAPAATASASGMSIGYFVDRLFRKDPSVSTTASTPNPTPDDSSKDGAPSGEVIRAFANAAREGALAPEDAKYVGQLVAQRTGLAPADAEKRVTDTFNQLQAAATKAKEEAKAAADRARKASAIASLWFFVSLLIGAFVASFMATLGGRHRDQF